MSPFRMQLWSQNLHLGCNHGLKCERKHWVFELRLVRAHGFWHKCLEFRCKHLFVVASLGCARGRKGNVLAFMLFCSQNNWCGWPNLRTANICCTRQERGADSNFRNCSFRSVQGTLVCLAGSDFPFLEFYPGTIRPGPNCFEATSEIWYSFKTLYCPIWREGSPVFRKLEVRRAWSVHENC
jgi:hypothetical protein